MKIVLKESEAKGFATANDNDKIVGTMTYSIAGKDLIIIDHTDVDPNYNGQGIGKKMLDKIVEMARERYIKIMPLCPFAASVFKKTEAIKDVLK